MTLDERTLELIHAELDGEIDAAGRAELGRLTERDPSVRRQRDELRRLHETLAAVESLESPIGLKTAIMAGVDAAATTGGGRRRAFERWFGGLAGSTGARAAMLAAAALVVVAFAWPFVADGLQVDPAAARGTIGADADGRAATLTLPDPDETVSSGIMFDGAEGVVRLAPATADGRVTVEIVIDARRPLRLEIGAAAATLIDATVVEGPDDALRRDGGRLTWEVADRGGIVLTLAAAEATTLEMHGTRAGAAIGSVRVPIGTR